MEHKSQRYQYHGMTVVTTDLSRRGELSLLQGMSLLLTYHSWQLWPGHQLSSLRCVCHRYVQGEQRCFFLCDGLWWLKVTLLTCRLNYYCTYCMCVVSKISEGVFWSDQTPLPSPQDKTEINVLVFTFLDFQFCCDIEKREIHYFKSQLLSKVVTETCYISPSLDCNSQINIALTALNVLHTEGRLQKGHSLSFYFSKHTLLQLRFSSHKLVLKTTSDSIKIIK